MAKIEELAEAALLGNGVALRSMYQELFHESRPLRDLPRPNSDDAKILAAAASLVELLAERTGQDAPSWANDVGPLDEPIYLVASAAVMRRLRTMCENEAPEPLRKRRLYAPPNFIEFA